MNLRTGIVCGILAALMAAAIPALMDRGQENQPPPSQAAAASTSPSSAPGEDRPDTERGDSRTPPVTPSPVESAAPSPHTGDYPQDAQPESTDRHDGTSPDAGELPDIPQAGDLSDKDIRRVLSNRMARRLQAPDPVAQQASKTARAWLAADLEAAQVWQNARVRAVQAVDPLGPPDAPTEVTVVAVWSNDRGAVTELHQSELHLRKAGTGWDVVP